MEDNILKDFETFCDYPDKLMKLDKNSNYFILFNKDSESYIVKEIIKKVETFDKKGKLAVLVEKNYLDLCSSEIVETTTSWYYQSNPNKVFKKKNNILLLNSFEKIYGIKEKNNKVVYLNIDEALYMIGKRRVTREKTLKK